MAPAAADTAAAVSEEAASAAGAAVSEEAAPRAVGDKEKHYEEPGRILSFRGGEKKNH